MSLQKNLSLAIMAIIALVIAGCSSEKPETDNGVRWPTATLIDPNTASADLLSGVPGIDATLAEAVIAGRPYATASDLNAVLATSLDETALREVYKLVFVKVELNDAAEDDLKLIPSSLSPRKFAHEIEEYRPYASMQDFRRELGKYVSETELAYLERFVYLSE